MKAVTLGMLIVGSLVSTASCEDTGADFDGWLVRARANLDSALNLWDLEGMMGARAEFERLLATRHETALVHYYVAYADYRIAIYDLAAEDKEQCDHFLDDGLEQVEEAERLRPDFSDAPALRAALYGIKIAVSPVTRGFTFGPRSGRALAEAYGIDDSNPRAYLIDGYRLFRTPRLFGGGHEKAMEKLRRAAELFEARPRDKTSIEPCWGHAEVFAVMGQIQMEDGEFDAAEVSYRTALEIDPDYGWVKFRLIPMLEEAREANN